MTQPMSDTDILRELGIKDCPEVRGLLEFMTPMLSDVEDRIVDRVCGVNVESASTREAITKTVAMLHFGMALAALDASIAGHDGIAAIDYPEETVRLFQQMEKKIQDIRAARTMSN